MSTINIVNFYLPKKGRPLGASITKGLMALAYRTACERKIHPKAIFIRSREHTSSHRDGQYQLDPRGWHVTFSYKDKKQIYNNTHVSSHVYVKGKGDLTFVSATHRKPKRDSILKPNGDWAWPRRQELKVALKVAYSHFPTYSQETRERGWKYLKPSVDSSETVCGEDKEARRQRKKERKRDKQRERRREKSREKQMEKQMEEQREKQNKFEEFLASQMSHVGSRFFDPNPDVDVE